MTDREKLIEILQYGMDKYFLLKFEAEIFADLLIANGVTFATDTAKNVTSVDTVEVVRCRDCKYRKTERCQMYLESEDGREQYNWETDDDFCSSGKRRDDRKKERIEARVFDKEDVYTNCTVQILTNTVTGDVSVGWWRNDKMPYGETPMEE